MPRRIGDAASRSGRHFSPRDGQAPLSVGPSADKHTSVPLTLAPLSRAPKGRDADPTTKDTRRQFDHSHHREHPSETIERLYTRASDALIRNRFTGDFTEASALLDDIVRQVPGDFRAHACRAFIAWSAGKIDRDSMSAMQNISAEATRDLLHVHDLIEQTLAASSFESGNTKPDERPAIVVPGKELTADGSMDEALLERMQTALDIVKRHPDAPIIVSGAPTVTQIAECDVMADWLVARGVSRSRLLLDRLSTVTTANALRAVSLLRAHPDINVMRLVTSDEHMRRSRVVFDITLMQSGLPIDLQPVIAGGKQLGAATHVERMRLYCDAMRAYGLIAYRARPGFYKDSNGIGDEIPGDRDAHVKVELSEPDEVGDTPVERDVIEVTSLARGDLVRRSEGALLARLLKAYQVLPTQKIVIYKNVEADNPLNAVTDALAELGLRHSAIKQEGDRLSVYIARDSVDAARSRRMHPNKTGTVETTGARLPVIAAATDGDRDTSIIVRKRELVVGGARFAVSGKGDTTLNGSVHAAHLDDVHQFADASFDAVRIKLDDWRYVDWEQLGRDAARVLRTRGQITVSTRRALVPRGPIVDVLSACGFENVSTRVAFLVETPFYPVHSDPSAGGVAFEGVKSR
ncbi:YdcF family protein [Trinickia sp. LjRoot230]|uniref:YdcF family protein n=1 Tax=Trinickia sp. LjRoot230 TaxID=3342288 RepID=UPI003ECD45AA